MKPFTSTSENLNNPNRKKERKRKIQNQPKGPKFPPPKTFHKKREIPKCFCLTLFFTLTQLLQVSKSSRESANCQLILSLE